MSLAASHPIAPARAALRVPAARVACAPASEDRSDAHRDAHWNASGAPAQMRGIAWHAPEGELERLAWRHALLMLATGGLYVFWAKVDLRQRLWNAIRLGGTPLHYTGTVRDLLVPALAGFGVLAVLALALGLAWYFRTPLPKPQPSPWRFVVTIPLVYMIGLRLWRSRRYLLEHTVWRGRPGALADHDHAYARTHFLTMLAMPLTLGAILPWRQTVMARQMWRATELGGHGFAFDGSPRPLYRHFWGVWLGAIGIYLGVVLTLAFTMGPKITAAQRALALPAFSGRDIAIIAVLAIAATFAFTALFAWYRAGLLRALAASLSLDGARFTLDVSTKDFVRLAVANMALKLASLGLLAGLCEVRLARFLVARVVVTGDIPADTPADI